MSYDNHKQQTPPEEPQNECVFCGEPFDKIYCSTACKKAYENEN